MPIIVSGKSVSEGNAEGKIVCLDDNTCIIKKMPVFDVQRECLRFHRAVADSMNQLQATYERALHKVGESDAKIFVIQQMMIHEQSFVNDVKGMISSEMVTAQYAVFSVASSNIKMLESTDDEYMRARATDIRDVSQRIIRILTNKSHFKKPWGKNLIIYKYAITPSEIIELTPEHVSAIITYTDSYYSHSSILSRTMKIPYITNISEEIGKYHGHNAAIDTNLAQIIID